MLLPNLFKADISRRKKPGRWSSPWLKNFAVGCQHPFWYQKCFISLWTTSPPWQVWWFLPPVLPGLPTLMQLTLWNFSATHRSKGTDLNSICERQTQTSSLRILVWTNRLHCCGMWEKSYPAISGNRVYDFSWGWVQVCSSSPGSGVHALERQRISDKPLYFVLSSACAPSQHAVLSRQLKECGIRGHPYILGKVDVSIYIYIYISLSLYIYMQFICTHTSQYPVSIPSTSH